MRRARSRFLIMEPEPLLADQLGSLLDEHGAFRIVRSLEEALFALSACTWTGAVIDVSGALLKSLDFCRTVRGTDPALPMLALLPRRAVVGDFLALRIETQPVPVSALNVRSFAQRAISSERLLAVSVFWLVERARRRALPACSRSWLLQTIASSAPYRIAQELGVGDQALPARLDTPVSTRTRERRADQLIERLLERAPSAVRPALG
jgi:hypothetical protein